jgi:hypothetical protein
MAEPDTARRYLGVAEFYQPESKNYDYVATSSAESKTQPAFYVDVAPGSALVPLFRYYCPEQLDTFLTTDWSELTYGYATWRYSGILGFISERPGDEFVRLYRWFSERDRNHAYSIDSSWGMLKEKGGASNSKRSTSARKWTICHTTYRAVAPRTAAVGRPLERTPFALNIWIHRSARSSVTPR